MASGRFFRLEAWTFICMIALQWYYDLSERLKKAELSNRYAPMNMVRSLSRVRTVRVERKWMFRTLHCNKKLSFGVIWAKLG